MRSSRAAAAVAELGSFGMHTPMKLCLQSFAGLLMTIGGFVAGAFLTTLIPGAGGKYMSPLGEFIVAVVIFAATLGLAIVARFARSVLFLTLGLTAVFVIVVLTLLYSLSSDPEKPML